MKDSSFGPHPTLGADGKYRWRYDLHLLRNWSVLIDVAKVMGLSLAITIAIILLIVACSGDMSLGQTAAFCGQLLLIMGAIFLVLTPLGYLIYAWLMGWKYQVLFTMDAQELIHEQEPAQARKAAKIGSLTAAAGAIAGRPGVVGTGTMTSTRFATTTTLAHVRRVVPCRRMNMIKVNQRLSKNRVYVLDEDFDFVYRFLLSHCQC